LWTKPADESERLLNRHLASPNILYSHFMYSYTATAHTIYNLKAVLCGRTIQYSPDAIRYPCTSCLIPAFDDALCNMHATDVSVICHITYFEFPIQSAFLVYIGRQAAPALRRTIGFNTQYQISDAAENLGKYVSCTEHTAKAKDFELILMVIMETRHPVEGQFGSEFLTICNHCGVIVS